MQIRQECITNFMTSFILAKLIPKTTFLQKVGTLFIASDPYNRCRSFAVQKY